MERWISSRRAACLAVLLFGLCLVRCGGGNPPSKQPLVVSVSISPASATVQVNQSVLFSFSVTGSSNTAVTLQVNGIAGGNSTVGTITSGGTYTAPANVPDPATVTITVISQADLTKTASATVTITPAPAVTVSVSPGTANTAAGATVQFTATIRNTTNHNVTWMVNDVAGGNASVGTVSDSGLYTSPVMTFSPLTVAVTVVSEADSAKSASAQVNVLAAHRIGVRVVGGLGEFYDRMTGSTFTPRGNNYTRLATLESFLGGTSETHSTFNVGLYDASRVDLAFDQMQSAGYNVVRVFLEGCCVGSIGDPAGGLSSGYLANLADSLEKAKAHNLYVIPTIQWTPYVPRYGDLVNQSCCTLFASANLYYLTEGGIAGNSLFWSDLIQGLTNEGAHLDAILAFELRNELYFDSDYPPLSLSSGTVTTANGSTYDMADPAARQAMMDENLVNWTDQMRKTILGLDPTALVSLGFFVPQGPNPARIGDSRVIQPYPAMANSTADFVDLHPYPGVDLPLAQYVENFGFGSYLSKPVIMGEFGAFKFVYATPQDAAPALQSWQAESCLYKFKGWLLWTWDTDEQPELWNGLSEAGQINEALAPTNRPDPCLN